MSAYPTTGDEVRVSFNELLSSVTAVFQACGMSADDAALLADSLVDADVSGVHSHGVLRVPEYVAKLTGGGVDPTGRPTVVREKGASAVVDAANAMGQIACSFAMKRAIDLARAHAVGVVAVRGSNHCGAMAYYVKAATREDMIGLAVTNALPTMAPWGGLDKIVGINPLGVALPGAEEPDIVFDAAFAGSSHGKIRVFQQKGLSIPPTWAFDSNGEPTTDAAAAVEGLLQPIGGHKGVGLAMVFGLLSTLLSGAAYGTELGDMVSGPKSGVDGHLLIAIDVAAFLPPAELKRRVDAAIRQVRESRRKQGVERLYSPGELETETRERFLREGIPLAPETAAGLADAAGTVGAELAAALRR